ncbi:MAG: FAD-dependent oxidoreductase [Acidobacteriota bacterium]|nr:FAD-dependent oxidoreductase [Acidobacteriota bacterium]
MDIVVAGGGIIGLATAWRLAQRGLRVAVWEAGRVGGEASWAGAGMLAPGGELDARNWWSDLAIESLREYPEFVRELEQEAGIPIDFRACGALEYAFNETEWLQLTERARTQREWGIRSQQAGDGRMFYPDDSAVDPRDVVECLRICCARSGVTLREEQPVREIRVEQGRIAAPECAAAAVVAAGAWSSGIAIRVEGTLLPLEPSVPVRGHLISFAAGAAPPGPIVRHGHTYILERSNGLTIAGSTTERVGFDRNPDPAQVNGIGIRAAQLMPRLKGMAVTAAWVGFRPGTESGDPQLGRLADTPVFLAYGHYRNGILMAPASARRLTREITASSQTDSFLQAGHR